MKNYKDQIIDNLRIMVAYNKKKGTSFKMIAYANAIRGLKKFPEPITKDLNIKDLKKIDGVGKSIAEKIVEFMNTGKMKAVIESKKEMEEQKDTKEGIIDSFKNIWGVGEVKAEELYKKGFRSIAEIEENSSDLNDKQLIGLSYYKDLLKKLPRDYITLFGEVMKYIIDENFGNKYAMKIAGSYRRKLKTSGDIDILITSKEFTLVDLIDLLVDNEVVTEILSMLNEKFMGIAHCPSGKYGYFRLDIEFIPENEWYSTLLYFTGSKSFNAYMRLEAKKQGYHLDQHGIYKKLAPSEMKKISKEKGINLEKFNNAKEKKKARSFEYALTENGLFKRIPINSEKGYFDIINLNYLQPEDRD